MDKALSDLRILVDDLNTTTSSNDKIAALKRHPECKDLLFHTYNPFFRFHVSSANIQKNSKLPPAQGHDSISTIALLDCLRTRSVTGNEAISRVLKLIEENQEHRDLIFKIIDRNLECRIQAGLINKAFPELIPQMNVALAGSYWDNEKNVSFETDSWYASRKLDGCRCNLIVDDSGEVSCWSRGGREFTTLGNLIEEFKAQFPDVKNRVFDGEICILDGNGNEDFQSVMKEIKRKDHTIKNPCLMIFDMLSYDEFIGDLVSDKLSRRFENLKNLFNGKSLKTMNILEQIKVTSKKHFLELYEESQSHPEWEGLIIRRDTIYEGKRSRDMLKVKSFSDGEYVVERIVPGEIRFIENGVEKSETMLSHVIVRHKGFEVGVGSGWSLEQRRLFYRNPSIIVGRQITVKYFAESVDQNGNLSLRFPTMKCVVGEERDV